MTDRQTEKLFTLADEIGLMLTQTAEYSDFRRTRDEALASDDASLFTEYTERSTEISKALRQGIELSSDELRDFSALRSRAYASARVVAFIESAEKYADLLDLIRKTVAEETA